MLSKENELDQVQFVSSASVWLKHCQYVVKRLSLYSGNTVSMLVKLCQYVVNAVSMCS